MQLEYTFRDMAVTLAEPLARHEIEAETLHGQLLNEWAKLNDKPGASIGSCEWRLIVRFAELFVQVAHVEQPLDFMPPCPLPEAPAALYDAHVSFWEDAPKAFMTAHTNALEDVDGVVDPNV